MAIGKLEQDIIDFFNEKIQKTSISINLKFLFLSKSTQKQVIKLTKIPEHYSYALKKDILVEVNETYYDNFNSEDDKINDILFDQEIDKIEVNYEKGTFRLAKPSFASSKGIIDKYTFEEVDRAIETERLFKDQKDDKDQE